MTTDTTPLSRTTILLVDDDESALRSAKAILHGNNFPQLLEATDGVGALSLVQALGEAIGLIVTDIQLRKLDGVTLVQSVRKDFPDIRVIYVSKNPQPKSLGTEEYCAFIRKPFSPDIFMTAVRECLEGSLVSP